MNYQADVKEVKRGVFTDTRHRSKLEATKDGNLPSDYLEIVAYYIHASYRFGGNPIPTLSEKGWKVRRVIPANEREKAGAGLLVELFQVAQVGDKYYSIELSVELGK